LAKFFMAQAPNATQEAPSEGKFPTVVRAVGLGLLVLILWYVDKLAVGRLPTGSVWRYVISGVIAFVGLITVLSISDRLSHKNS
jgi:hypothetical protein